MPIVSFEEFIASSFDYLILGGGTAGCVIAGRLSEDPNVTVGVIEAGGAKLNDPIVDTPGALMVQWENPDYDWCYYTPPQSHNKNKAHHIIRGKMLGGTSGINGMMYVRPSSEDFDSWAVLVGDDQWSAKAMTPYLKKSERAEPTDPHKVGDSSFPFSSEYHGTEGPIRTSFNDSSMEIEQAVIKACYDVTPMEKMTDAWSGNHLGFFNTLNTISRTGPNKGKRSYAIDHLDLDKPRPNLKILCDAHVNKINLEGLRAVGANFSFGGQKYNVKAAREVILCAGSIISPQILELSGIGDPDILKAANVECVVPNRAVGANFQDHILTSIIECVKDDVFTFDWLHQRPELREEATKQYGTSGSGWLATGFSTQGFLPFKRIASQSELNAVIQSIKDTKPTSEFHARQMNEIIKQIQSDTSGNLQLIFMPTTWDLERGVQHQSQALPPRPANEAAGVSFMLCVEYPLSRGSVHIESSDPTRQPVLNPNYGGHEADRVLLAAALRWMDQVTKSQHLSGLLGERMLPPPACDLQDLQQGLKAVENIVMGEYHVCGSVAMGDALDSHLRVKGVQNLRVVDASVFPNNVSGNILGTIYAVAERAADFIKEDMN